MWEALAVSLAVVTLLYLLIQYRCVVSSNVPLESFLELSFDYELQLTSSLDEAKELLGPARGSLKCLLLVTERRSGKYPQRSEEFHSWI